MGCDVITWQGYILSKIREPFVWGQNDCCLFAANGYLEVTGTDYMKDVRGYTTEAGAFTAMLNSTGANSLFTAADIMAERIGMNQVTEYEDGDLVLIRLPHANLKYYQRAESMGLVLHPYCYTVGPTGLIKFPLTEIIKGYRKWQ